MIVMMFIEKILEKNQNVLTPRGSIENAKGALTSELPFIVELALLH